MKYRSERSLSILCGFCLILLHQTVDGWGQDKIALSDVKALTLTNGQMTTARRSHPVPQLVCVGGTAGCNKFVPRVVQCINMGTDGHDVQWECKTDMNKEFRFGKIEVTCEGYDYPDDPYILKGSCGLEYTIDYAGTGGQRSSYSHDYSSYDKSSSGLGNLVFLAIIGLIIYAVYHTCVANTYQSTEIPYPRADRPYPEASAPPPPPGFRPEYTQNYGAGGSTFGGCNDNSYGNAHRSQNSGAGFWSGMGLGSLAGYMFGSRNRRTYPGYNNAGYGSQSWWGSNGSSWTSSGSDSGFSGSSMSSNETRTASGFGGTKRR